jgi:hypothetical protein
MHGPRERGAYDGRIADCGAALAPLVKDYMAMQRGGMADAKMLEKIVLPAARAAGWSKGDIAMALRTKVANSD